MFWIGSETVKGNVQKIGAEMNVYSLIEMFYY